MSDVPVQGMVRRRAVVLVGGPAAPYSRAIRIARALAAEQFDVEIAAVAAPGLADREPVAAGAPGAAGEPLPEEAAVGSIEIRRYQPSGIWAWLGASDGLRAGSAGTSGGPRRGGTLRRLVRLVATPVIAVRRWAVWPHAVRGWWATLARDLPPADLYHACGSLAIAPALAAKARQGGSPTVIYDAIDDVTESNEAMGMPAAVRRRNARIEAGWAREADAVVTVNDPLAGRLGERWRLPSPPLVVANLPEPAPAGSLGEPNRIRTATGLPASTRVILFHGRVGPHLGLEEAAEAVLLVRDAALVVMGFGRGMAASQARDRDPRYAGRHVTLPAVHPDELLAWTASADVALIPLPPVSVNQRLSTPNKLWEALAAGTPVVVVAGLEVMERLVTDHDLGAVAASTQPADLAAALERVLERAGRDGDAWRARIAATARERFSWPAVATAYRSLVRSLAGAPEKDGGAASQSA